MLNQKQKMMFIRHVYKALFSIDHNPKFIHEKIKKVKLNKEAWADYLVYTSDGILFNDKYGTKEDTIPAIDVIIKTNGGKRKLRFITQNPNKLRKDKSLSKWARRARRGEKIMWVIDKERRRNAFLGLMLNGRWINQQRSRQ